MTLITNYDYQRRRAQRVLHLLQQLWGEELPDGPEPELMVLIDAVAGDDQFGTQDGYVVQSDCLTYDALAVLLRRCSTPAIAAGALPRELLSRVFNAAHTGSLILPSDIPTVTPTVTPTVAGDAQPATRPATARPSTGPVTSPEMGPGMEPETTPASTPATTPRPAQPPAEAAGPTPAVRLTGPDTASSPTLAPVDPPPAGGVDAAQRPLLGLSAMVGTWHLDERQQLSWDEAAAAVLARPDAPRCTNMLEELEVWIHHEDRPAVLESFERCLHAAEPHQVHFRALNPRGGYVPCVASGRRLIDISGHMHVVGVLHQDPSPPQR